MAEVLAGQMSFWVVFVEGVLSFFSPCVLPLLPIYMGYLAGGGECSRWQVLGHTVGFVLGISTVFFLLGLSFGAIGSFLTAHQVFFARLGGVLIMALGLMQLGFWKVDFLQRQWHLPFRLGKRRMNVVWAWAMGFAFSFAWTPCVGPALSAVLILAAGAKTMAIGNVLVLVYTAGFVLPFLLVGLFTTEVLAWLKNKGHLLRYTAKLGGALLMVMGFMVCTGWMNGVTNYLNDAPPEQREEVRPVVAALDFTLVDQYGESHHLADYRGKVVFLNFWTTWCNYCVKEMPDIEELYQAYGQNTNDVIFLGVANPQSADNPSGQDIAIDGVQNFLKEKGYTFPTVFDMTGAIYEGYGIRSFPTTYMIDKDGNIYGYVSGAMTKDMMQNVIEQTLAHTNP